MALLQASAREIVRFFRARETLWILLAVSILFTAPIPAIGLLARSVAGLDFVPDTKSFDLGYRVLYLTIAEVAHNVIALIELAIISILAYYLANRTLRQEVDSGSWVLLKLTPTPVRHVLLGKAFGVGAVIVAVHSYLFSFLFLYTPLIRRTDLKVWSEFVTYFIVAASFIPEGLAFALVKQQDKRAQLLSRLGSVIRIGALFLLLHLAIVPDDNGVTASVFDVVIAFFSDLVGQAPRPPGAFYAAPVVPLIIVVGWQILSGLGIWYFGVVRRSER